MYTWHGVVSGIAKDYWLQIGDADHLFTFNADLMDWCKSGVTEYTDRWYLGLFAFMYRTIWL